ncbi:MAG: GlsB/YeaQ/YmgE family stress response membrane protein [Pelolinea sp.]|nr:GlsB/YeaQ/YmgE family stress response membrane protein [Pelolinea sp.]
MNIITLLIVGLVAGFLADKVVKNSFGLLGDLIVGVIGSFIGSWLFGQLGLSIGSGLIGEIIIAFIGAVLLLLIVNLFKRRN